jgi:hypothetical protein
MLDVVTRYQHLLTGAQPGRMPARLPTDVLTTLRKVVPDGAVTHED